MLLMIGILIAVTAMVSAPRLWLRFGMHAQQMGCMSERWLAEYDASHP